MMAWPLNLVEYGYNAEDVMRWMAGKTSGVYGQEGNYQVVWKSGMTVTVKAEGMLGGWLSNMQRYGIAFWNATDIDLEVPIGDGVNPRIDRVVVSWHIPNQSELPQVVIRQGTPAATPEPPALVNDGEYAEICLAEIAIAAGAITLSAADITDTRYDEGICGLVSMGIEKIPTDGLYQQWLDWFENLKVTLDNDVAANLYEQIQQRVKRAGDTMTGALIAAIINSATAQVRNISLTTTDLEDGVTPLANGEIRLVYEGPEIVNTVAAHDVDPLAHTNLLVDGNNSTPQDDTQTLEQHQVNTAAHQNLSLDGNLR